MQKKHYLKSTSQVQLIDSQSYLKQTLYTTNFHQIIKGILDLQKRESIILGSLFKFQSFYKNLLGGNPNVF